MGSPPMDVINKKNTSPYIIAYGPSNNEIVQYFIVVEQQLIAVPENFDFIRTFDLMYKTHAVFNNNFGAGIKGLMAFIQHFVYEIKTTIFVPTGRMLEI